MRRILLVLICVLFFSIFSVRAEAATIFKDDFNSDPNGSFPSKWTSFITPGALCNASWIVQDGQVRIKIPNQSSCGTNIIPKNTEWPSLLNNYSFEADIKLVSGTDHNIGYRAVPSGPSLYEVHFQSPGDFGLSYTSGQIIKNISQGYALGQTYHIKITVVGVNIKVYINGILVKEALLDSQLPPGLIALRAGVGGDPSSETWFDNVVVSTIDQDLNVPLLKQTSSAWGSQLYDSANLWAPSNQRGISNWGCAITSAAMVFQYQKITKMPDGSNVDPKSINAWLKSRPLGYIKEGWVNWAELAVLSKLSKSKNPAFTYDTLEYQYSLGADKDKLESDISNKNPAILEEPGHFVVAKGIDGLGGYLINDPYYAYTNLSSYGNTFSKSVRFIPSNSDLSYIILAADGDTKISIRDSIGDPIGDTFVQDPIKDDVGGQATNGKSLRFAQIAKPAGGNYSFEVWSDQKETYSIDILLYDKDGNGKKITLNGIVDPDKVDRYFIKLDKNDVNKSSAKKEVNFDSLISEVNYLCNSGEIKIYCPAILAQVKTAKDAAGFKPTIKAAISILKALDNQINTWKGKGVSPAAYNILHDDLQALISSL